MISLGMSLIILGIIFIILSFLGFGSRGSIKAGPFSASGTIGLLIIVLGAVVYLIEEGLIHL